MEDENMYNKVSKFDSRPKIDSYNDMEADNIDEEVDDMEEEDENDMCSIELSLSGYHLNPESIKEKQLTEEQMLEIFRDDQNLI